jgi:hypothetical protein
VTLAAVPTLPREGSDDSYQFKILSFYPSLKLNEQPSGEFPKSAVLLGMGSLGSPLHVDTALIVTMENIATKSSDSDFPAYDRRHGRTNTTVTFTSIHHHQKFQQTNRKNSENEAIIEPG